MIDAPNERRLHALCSERYEGARRQSSVATSSFLFALLFTGASSTSAVEANNILITSVVPAGLPHLIEHITAEPSTPTNPCHNRAVAGSTFEGRVAAHGALEALHGKLFQVEKGRHKLHILCAVPQLAT